MERLRQSALARLGPAVRRPQYDRERLKIGMAHIGVGAFHRCHQAEFIDDALEAQFGPWGGSQKIVQRLVNPPSRTPRRRP